MTPDDRRLALALMVLMTNADAIKRGALPIWTIYDRPLDYPDGYIARLHELAEGKTLATDRKHTGELEELRLIFWQAGLLKITRNDKPRAICFACGAEQPYGRIRCDQCGRPLVFPASFVCPHCGAESHNLNDIVERYCGRCHVFVDDEADKDEPQIVESWG